MNRFDKYIIPFLTVIMLSLYACFSTNRVSIQNIADIYHSDFHYLHPQFYVYHVNDTSTLLYYKIDQSELLYIRRNQADSFSASARVLCKVTSAYEAANIVDSNSVTLKFSSASNNKTGFYEGYFPVKIKVGGDYLLTIVTSDLISKKQDVEYMDADKTNPNTAQNFLVKTPDDQVLFHYYSDTATTVSIACNHPLQNLTVNYYNRNFPIASPPFAQQDIKPFQYKPDSTFTISAVNGTYKVKIPAKGFYHIQPDTFTHNGLTLYRFEKFFPTVGNAHEMVPPLRYITSTDEYTRCTTATNVKKAVDDFWLNIAGNNEDRARTLIRTYYNRIKDANNYFTSYMEGWKTDRGMIYIIFGPPNVVYRTSTTESWTYGEDRNFMSLNFTFQKTNNPFSDNDFALDRTAQYRNVWYNAVDIWREGRVY